MTAIADPPCWIHADKASPHDFSLDAWKGEQSISPRECLSDTGSSREDSSKFPSPPPLMESSPSEEHNSAEEPTNNNSDSMHEYDNEPVPVEELLRDKDLYQDSRDELMSSIQEHSMWTKRDLVVASSGLYRPWFFSRFAKGWIEISRQHALSDIRSILGSGRAPRNKEISPRDRQVREISRDNEKLSRPKRCSRRTESSDEESDEEPETWVGCDECGKWRKIPDGVEVDTDNVFFCSMLPDVTCSVPEEQWNEPGGDKAKGCRSKSSELPSSIMSKAENAGKIAGKRKLPSSPTKEKKARKMSPVEEFDEPLSPEDITTAASSLYQSAGVPAMSRLTAVVRVLSMSGKPMHYDLLTRQALKLGLIKFTGSQGTAGESMKAFLNKTIRENKSAAIINLGKGIYGLKEWNSEATPRSAASTSAPASPLSALCADDTKMMPDASASPKHICSTVQEDAAHVCGVEVSAQTATASDAVTC